MGNGDPMQIEPNADPLNTTEKAKKELRAALVGMHPQDQQRYMALIAHNRQQFENTKQGRLVKSLVDDYKLKNSKMLSSDPELAAQVDMYLATAEYDPRTVMENFNKLREAVGTIRQQHAMAANLGMPEDGMGPPNIAPFDGLTLSQMQGVRVNRLKNADNNQSWQQGIEMGVRRDPRTMGPNGGLQFDDEAFRQKMIDLGSSPEEAAMLTQIAAAQRLGRVGSTVSAGIINPQSKPDPYADDRVRLTVNQAQDDERMAMEEYKGLNAGALNGPTAAEYDSANDQDPKAIAKVTAWTRYLGARQKTREARRQGAASLVVPPVQRKAPPVAGPSDTSTMSPREIRDQNNPSPGSARTPPDGATLLSEFAKQFPGVKPDRNNPAHVKAAQEIKARLEGSK